ncbi:MAG: GFA family protein [Alphaproteobacteria bacterium]|nr:GFA family protein [Alphaproteobacteria bacterium]
MSEEHSGGCLCGAVRFRVTLDRADSGYCHCRMCQRTSGAPVVAWVVAAPSGLVVTRAAPAIYHSSAHGQREFCAICGSYLFFRDAAEGIVSINTAVLDDPETVPPTHHIWTQSRIPWFETADTLQRFPEAGGSPP